MDYQARYEEWLSNPYFDADTKAELEGIKGTITRSRNVSIQTLNLERQD